MTEEIAPRAHGRTPETDEVLRRIGRNVVIFQQVEEVLKYLNAHARVKAPASQLAAHVEGCAEAVHKKTMGDLAGKLVGNVLTPATEEEYPDVIDEVWVGFRFSIDTDTEFLDRHDNEMRALVDARNDLIHHFLPQWDSARAGDTDRVLAYLDAQREETVRMLERLQGWAESLDLMKKKWAEFWVSGEGQRQFDLAFLRSSRLVVMLGEIASQTPRADGWTLLSTAGHLIKRDAPSELDDLPTRFGYPTLKGVLLAAELFDVAEEPLPRGGTRTLYRINDRYELHRMPHVSAAVDVPPAAPSARI